MRRTILAALLLLLPGLAWAQSSDYIKFYPPAGLSQLSASATGVTSTLPFLAPAGTALLPGFAFAGDPDTGFFNVGPNVVTLSAGGGEKVAFGVYGGIQLVNSSPLSWSSQAWTNDVSDVFLYRDGAANILAQKNSNADQFFRLYGANGGYWEKGVNSELLTLAVAASTDTTGNLLPANAIIEAVVVRVTTIIPTAATFIVGDATTAARFATGVLVAADTTAVGLLHRHPDVAAAAGPVQIAAAKVRITPNAQPAAATGVVRIEVFFSRFVPPTS